jgi:hypothetical protein
LQSEVTRDKREKPEISSRPAAPHMRQVASKFSIASKTVDFRHRTENFEAARRRMCP